MKREAYASIAPLAARREEICAVVNDSYDPAAWGDWRWQMRHRLTRLDQFDRLLRLTEAERRGLTLASEKFFSLCDDFGAENVGMLTGDAAINPRAPIVCCIRVSESKA